MFSRQHVTGLFLAVIVLLVFGCNKYAASEQGSIIGSWKVMGTLRTPIELDKIVENDIIGGSMTFKPDGTFDAEIVYPQFPDKTIRTSGTYTLENEFITISNPDNNSITRSKYRFEQGFLIITPTKPNGFTTYLKPLSPVDATP